MEDDLNIGAPEERLALPRTKKKALSSNSIKGISFSICSAAIAGYVIAYYFIPKTTLGVRVALTPIALEIAGPALLDARNKVTITARIQGYLKAINVDRNDTVKTGEVLAELESADLASQLAAAEADAKAAASSIAEARSDQQRAGALAEKARQDYTRKLALRDKQIITEADWSATEAAFHQTQAELARSGTTIAKASAQSASAEANVNLLRVRLSYATIKSPLNGVVVSRDRNVGDLLSPGTPLVQLVDPDTIILSARLDESAMGTIGPGQVAIVHFASTPAEDFKGTVLRVIRLVDQETREFSVDITLDQLPNHWALGQRANVIIKAPSETPTIAIPQNLITRRNGRVGVWKLNGGSAEWTAIDLGYPTENAVQVVNGLNPGDVVLEPEGAYSHMPVALSEAGK
jgi:HlyD family secretion protein